MAGLAAALVKRLDGRSSRFDVALNPLGLGRVDVRLEIGADGRTTAALSFDRPESADLLRSRSGELRAALSQAGFDLPADAISFDVASGRGGAGFDPNTGSWAGSGGFGGGDSSGGSRAARLGAFSAAAGLDEPPPLRPAARARRGLDIRI